MRKELARLQVKRQDVVFPVPEGCYPRQPKKLTLTIYFVTANYA